MFFSELPSFPVEDSASDGVIVDRSFLLELWPSEKLSPPIHLAITGECLYNSSGVSTLTDDLVALCPSKEFCLGTVDSRPSAVDAKPRLHHQAPLAQCFWKFM